ncbi:MAG: hypothetical protein HDQ88_05240 [Clostridia bacterium]|nr:hypothetical protein [Clostridia bacterium]
MYNMVFCVVTDGTVASTDSLPYCDLAVFGFSGLGEVDYEKELKGETEKFEESARLSKENGCGLVCGCKTVSRGLIRKSVAVSDRGKLLGISDMLHVIDCEDFKSGSSLGFYRVNGCKVGLCIENDLLFPDTVKSLAMCGCNVIVAVLEEIRDNVPALLIRAYSYLYGIPIVMCAGKTAYFADISGAIATSTQKITLFEVSPKNQYHLVTTRVKGISSETKSDY